MPCRLRCLLGLVLAGALFAPARGAAEQIRFRFVPAGPGGALTQVATGPDGSLGERVVGLSRRREPYPYAIRMTQLVTVRNPATGANVMVPLRLPASTPRIEQLPDGASFNYNTYTVTVRFQADGSVDTIYNSGLLRPVSFD